MLDLCSHMYAYFFKNYFFFKKISIILIKAELDTVNEFMRKSDFYAGIMRVR